MPEVILEEPWIKVEAIGIKVEVNCSFSVVASERISSFFRP